MFVYDKIQIMKGFKKLDPEGKHNFIETKRGQGYRLINFTV